MGTAVLDRSTAVTPSSSPPAGGGGGGGGRPAPERSLEQRMEALGRANDVRTARAKLKQDLKAGRTRVFPLVLDPPEYIATMKVFEALLAVPKLGRVKVNRILGQCQISPSKTFGGITDRQRKELATELRRKH